MKSRFCHRTDINSTFYYPPSQQIEGSFNFSARFWQPFIDATIFPDGNTEICGPMLGVMTAFANWTHLSLGYVLPKDDIELHYQLMNDNKSNAVLYPFPPTTLEWSKSMLFTHPIGFIDTISILSSRTQLPPPLFLFTKPFSFNVWISTLISLMTLVTVHSCVTFKHCDTYIKYILHHPLSHFPEKRTLRYLLSLWLVIATILQWCFSALLLTNLIFTTPYSQIDSLQDLADKETQFMVFKGESAQEYIEAKEIDLTVKLHRKYTVEDPSNEEKEEWESKTFAKIADGKYVMVSDKPFLDYYYVLNVQKYHNLHRSYEHELPLPYYIPFSKHNSERITEKFTKILKILMESGVYNFWVDETLRLNGANLRGGLNEVQRDQYQYSQLNYYHLRGLFLVDLILCSVSIILFMGELFIVNTKFLFKRQFFISQFKC